MDGLVDGKATLLQYATETARDTEIMDILITNGADLHGSLLTLLKNRNWNRYSCCIKQSLECICYCSFAFLSIP